MVLHKNYVLQWQSSWNSNQHKNHKVCKGPSNDLGSISAIISEKKLFLYFPIWSCFNTMTCGGSHLGFRIGIKNPNFLRGPSNDYSWAVWFQLSKWFKRRSVLKHFSHRVQCYTKSCCSRHFESHIRTKDLNIKYYIYTNRCLK